MSSIGWLCCKLVIPTLGLLLLLHACPLLRVPILQLNQSWTFDELLSWMSVTSLAQMVFWNLCLFAASSFFLILCIEMFSVPKKYESTFFQSGSSSHCNFSSMLQDLQAEACGSSYGCPPWKSLLVIALLAIVVLITLFVLTGRRTNKVKKWW